MSCSAKESNGKNSVKFMFIFFFVIYLPLFFVTAFKFNISAVSLSNIGWRMGGPALMILYGIYTVPFMLYQIRFYVRRSGSRNRFLTASAGLGGALIMLSIATPFRENDSTVLHLLHSAFGMSGAVISMLTVTYVVAHFCVRHKARTKKDAALYAAFCVLIFFGYYFLRAAALFEMGVSLCFLFIMCLVNRAVLKAEKNTETYEAADLQLLDENISDFKFI